MTSRRELLTASVAGAVAVRAGVAPATNHKPETLAPDLFFLRENALLHEERARYFMRREGLDALVVNHPANVFYLSNHWPQLDRMGYTDSAIAIFARDAKRHWPWSCTLFFTTTPIRRNRRSTTG